MSRPKLRRIRALETSTVLSTANLVATSNIVLADVPGLVQAVVPGTYAFRISLQVSANASGGTRAAIKQNNGATLTSIQANTTALAAAVAVTQSTTATDAALLVGATAAHLFIIMEGRIVVATGGTLQIQAAQNASFATGTTVFAGSEFTLTRIG